MIDVLLDIVAQFWGVLAEMAPYLLFGFAVAGILSVLISPRLIERHLGRGRFWPVVKASAFGVPLPLCSCGVIPVSASLRRHGASRGAVTAFLMSTPQTGVDSILVTFSLLGGVFAIYRPIAALVAGTVGGLAVGLFDPTPPDQLPPAEERCDDACCETEPAGGSRFVRALKYGFWTLPRDIGPTLLIGLLVAGLITALMPEDLFVKYLGTGLLAMVVMMLLGLPMYVCATASIPVAASLIVHAGVTPGAAFAFLVTGPATNAATVVTMWKVLGKRTTVIYLITILAAALLGGLLLDQIITRRAIVDAPTHQMLPSIVGHVSAGVLLVLLAVAVIRGLPRREVSEMIDADEEDVMRIKVTGMTCSHCRAAVERAVTECCGVESASVNLDTGIATVSGADGDYNEIRQAITDLGYGVAEDAEPETGPQEGPANG